MGKTFWNRNCVTCIILSRWYCKFFIKFYCTYAFSVYSNLMLFLNNPCLVIIYWSCMWEKNFFYYLFSVILSMLKKRTLSKLKIKLCSYYLWWLPSHHRLPFSIDLVATLNVLSLDLKKSELFIIRCLTMFTNLNLLL